MHFIRDMKLPKNLPKPSLASILTVGAGATLLRPIHSNFVGAPHSKSTITRICPNMFVIQETRAERHASNYISFIRKESLFHQIRMPFSNGMINQIAHSSIHIKAALRGDNLIGGRSWKSFIMPHFNFIFPHYQPAMALLVALCVELPQYHAKHKEYSPWKHVQNHNQGINRP